METLKSWRQTANKSVPEAAAAVGVGRATWWRWEAGVRPVGLDSLQRVSSVTGIPASSLRPDLAAKLRGVAA